MNFQKLISLANLNEIKVPFEFNVFYDSGWVSVNSQQIYRQDGYRKQFKTTHSKGVAGSVWTKFPGT